MCFLHSFRIRQLLRSGSCHFPRLLLGPADLVFTHDGAVVLKATYHEDYLIEALLPRHWYLCFAQHVLGFQFERMES